MDPTVDVGEHSWRVCEPEVSFPAQQVRSERFARLREAASGIAPGQFAHTLLRWMACGATRGLIRPPLATQNEKPRNLCVAGY